MKTIMSALLASAVAISTFGVTIASAEAAVTKRPHRGGAPTAESTYVCGNELGYLRRVYSDEVEAIENASVVPVCENEEFGMMRNDSNAGALRQDLAANDDVMDALDAANFTVDEVVAVRITGDETAIIYVHTFPH
jgi:hypothetical protein